MTASILIFGWCVTAQFYADPFPAPEKMPEIFEHKDKSRNEIIVGYPQDRRWRAEWEAGRTIAVRVDSPWRETNASISPREYEHAGLEWEDRWRDRHLRGWEAAGYVNVGDEENFYFVPASERERADRAREMAAEVTGYNALPDFASDSPDSAESTTSPAAAAPPGVLRSWGPHAAVAVAAVALVGLILKTLILS